MGRDMVSLIGLGGRDGTPRQRWDVVAGRGQCGRDGMWRGMSGMGHGGSEGTWWQGWDAVSRTVWYVMYGTRWQGGDRVPHKGQGGRDRTWWQGGDRVSHKGWGGRDGTRWGDRRQWQVPGDGVSPWRGGPGVGRDLPVPIGCRWSPSPSPISPWRCRPRGREPALPGEWAPGPPGCPHPPGVPAPPSGGSPGSGGVTGAQPSALRPVLSCPWCLSVAGTGTRRWWSHRLGRGANRLVTVTGTPGSPTPGSSSSGRAQPWVTIAGPPTSSWGRHRETPSQLPMGVPGSLGAAVTPARCGDTGTLSPTPVPPAACLRRGLPAQTKEDQPVCLHAALAQRYQLNGETEARGLCGAGWGHRGALVPPASPSAMWLCGETPMLPVPGAGLMLVPPQRCSASCSPTWRAAWPGVTAPTGSPTTGTTSCPAPATPTASSSLVRGTGDGGRGCWSLEGHGDVGKARGDGGPGMPGRRDVGRGLLEPRGHGDRIAGAWGTWGQGYHKPGDMGTGDRDAGVQGVQECREGNAGAQGTWGQHCWSLGDIGRRGRGCCSLGDGGQDYQSPGDRGTGLTEPGGHGDGAAGAQGCKGRCHHPL